MWSVEILLYCYKAICVAFLWELNYYVFLNWDFLLLPPHLLNCRGCTFFVCVMNKSLIWKLLHKSHSIFGGLRNSVSSFSSTEGSMFLPFPGLRGLLHTLVQALLSPSKQPRPAESTPVSLKMWSVWSWLFCIFLPHLRTFVYTGLIGKIQNNLLILRSIK